MEQTDKEAPKGERIAKCMARAGVCSRREAERWIAAGRVAVNGNVLDTPAFFVVDADKILIDGKPMPKKESTRLWLYHKPKGMVTTHDDPQGRPTVFDALPASLPRVISVGRLDLNTEGLLLLTNDGALSRYLELPETGWERRYRVRLYGNVPHNLFEQLEKGVNVDGVQYGSITASLDKKQGGNSWLTMVLREGKNREIRRVLEHFDLRVNRLIRVSYGEFQLGNLSVGEVSLVSIKIMKEQLGSFLGRV